MACAPHGRTACTNPLCVKARRWQQSRAGRVFAARRARVTVSGEGGSGGNRGEGGSGGNRS